MRQVKSQRAKRLSRDFINHVIYGSQIRQRRKLDRAWVVLIKQVKQHLSQISPERREEIYAQTGITWIN